MGNCVTFLHIECISIMRTGYKLFAYGRPQQFLLTFTAIDRIEFPLYNISFYRGLPVLSNVNAPIRYSK